MSLEKQQGLDGLLSSKDIKTGEPEKRTIIYTAEPCNNPEGSDDDNDSDSSDDDYGDLTASPTTAFRPRGRDTYKKGVASLMPGGRRTSRSSNSDSSSRSPAPNQRYPPGLPPPLSPYYHIQPSPASSQSYHPGTARSTPPNPTHTYPASSQSQAPAVTPTFAGYYHQTPPVSTRSSASFIPPNPAQPYYSNPTSHQSYSQIPVTPSSSSSYQHSSQTSYPNPPLDRRYQYPAVPSSYPAHQHPSQQYNPNPSFDQRCTRASQTQPTPNSSNDYGTGPVSNPSPQRQRRRPSRPSYPRFGHN